MIINYIYNIYISSFESNSARFASGLGLNVCSFPALRPGFGTDAAGEGYELFKEAMAEIGILLCRHIHHPPNRGLVLCDEQHCLREQHPKFKLQHHQKVIEIPALAVHSAALPVVISICLKSPKRDVVRCG